jgi:hypothetical protein
VRLPLPIVLLALGFFPVAASAFPISGKKLVIKVSPSGNHALTVRSVDDSVDSGNFGTTGDPRCDAAGGGGGFIQVDGGGGNAVTITLPCGGWKGRGGVGDAYNIDYSYKDPTGATCRNVRVKHGHYLKAVCRGAQVAYALGTAQGDVAVTLGLGSAPLLNCAKFGPPPTVVTHDGSDGRKYQAKDAPPPPSCP